MKEIITQLYNGILRFFPVTKVFSVKSGHSGNFPQVGFLDDTRKKELEESLGVHIHNAEYFEQALIHRSYLQVLNGPGYLSNERLEFLGDSVLGMLVAEYLFALHSKVLEGELTKMRSWLVNKTSLAIAAHKLELERFIMLSFSAEKSMNNGSDSILADTMEAIIAAVYLDSGIDSARNLVVHTVIPMIMDHNTMTDSNYKSLLLEAVQSMGKDAPVYHVLEENGPDHDKDFLVAVFVDGHIAGRGNGKSKKQAEQTAAHAALKIIEKEQDYFAKGN